MHPQDPHSLNIVQHDVEAQLGSSVALSLVLFSQTPPRLALSREGNQLFAVKQGGILQLH